ncbi:uncharacterized protein TM35_000232520 [Trypanosoma theileri]|uniref:Uncharacterized protein n=1 Tax=Trypanosoma theileri TaxID=67003 RepID=A0A1X0NRQ6_9TRYP|nr:uncharacterized protein TM35_000232520 [Trypanosoma theileri]ORC87281.1 hypothetical protein TM35_000232520 [Trypanosoma theileri]
MSWCTTEEVAYLINVSRLRPDIAEDERKAADLRFIELHDSALNIGDVLTQLAVAYDNFSYGLRLSAALALESLVTQRIWCGGSRFSDKTNVVSTLLAFLRRDIATTTTTTTASIPAIEGRVHASLLSSFCRIIIFEYPGTHWELFLEECVNAIMGCEKQQEQQQQQQGKEYMLMWHGVVLRLSEFGSSNRMLWWQLANDVVRRLLESAVFSGRDQPRVFCLRVVLYLMKRRPRLAETTEGERPTNSFIFSSSFRHFIGCNLEERLTAFEKSDLSDSIVEECGLLLNIAQNLIHDADFASLVFHSSIRLLQYCESAYVAASYDEITPLVGCVDSGLECLAAVVQTFPEVSSQFDINKLLSTLFCYMTRATTTTSTALERGSEMALLTLLQDDYVVPLGCAGGDTASNAGAVLELLVDASPQEQLAQLLISLCNCVDGLQQGTHSPHWRAWITALRCLCRVCEEKEVSLTDSLPDAAGKLLGSLAELLHQCNDIVTAAELVDLLALCLARTPQTSLCRGFLSILETVFNTGSTIISSTSSTMTEPDAVEGEALRAVVIYAVHRLLSKCCTSNAISEFCDTAVWLQRALAIASRGGPLAVYSGAHAVCTLMRIMLESSPREVVLPQLQIHASLVLAAVDNACRHCAAVPDAASLLTGLLFCLCEHVSGNCALATELLHLVISHCGQPNTPPYALLLRSLTDYVMRLSKATVQQMCCTNCVTSVMQQSLPAVVHFSVVDAPHDEATTRLVSTSLAAAVSCGYAGAMCEQIGPALMEVLRSSVHERHSCTTLSTVVAAMSSVALVCPTLLDSDITEAVSLVFGTVDPAVAKGMNYTGCCLLPALFCIRRPQQLSIIITGLTTTQPYTMAWGTMFGIWSSVAPFADHFTGLYFLAAWHRILCYAFAAHAEGGDRLTVDIHSCNVYYLPSLHVKSLPKKRMMGCSIIQCIALGLVLMLHRWQRSSKTKLLDSDILLSLSLTRRFESLACCSVHDAGVDKLLSLSPTEGAKLLLQRMSDGGYGNQVNVAVGFVDGS